MKERVFWNEKNQTKSQERARNDDILLQQDNFELTQIYYHARAPLLSCIHYSNMRVRKRIHVLSLYLSLQDGTPYGTPAAC